MHRINCPICLLVTVGVFLAGVVAMATPDSVVAFNELHYHPPGNAQEDEWIELHNQMGIMTDVSGWTLSDGIDFTIPPNTFIPAQGYLVIAKNPKEGQLGPFSGALNNGGERLLLLNHSDRVMDDMTYGDSGRWPVAPDGSGTTLTKRNEDRASGPPENWTSSLQFGGTPGQANFPDPDDVALTTTRVLEESNAWRYNESGDDLGAGWAEQSHPAGGNWEMAPGPHGFEPSLADEITTQLAFPVANDPFVLTYYFETEITFTEDIASRLDHMLISHLVDDGAIFYVNGQEVLRFNMPSGDVDTSTLALSGEAEWVENVRIPSGSFVAGANRISVELHQERAGSSDVVFGMRLDQVTRPPDTMVVSSNLRLNELAPGVTGEFWLEIKNDGTAAENAGGMVLSISGDPAREVILSPDTMIEPGAHHLVPAQSFGFTVSDTDRVFLYAPDRSTVIDARPVGSRLRGRDNSPQSEWEDEWLFPTTPTPEATNVIQLNDAIVINEIFYHGPAISAQEGTAPTIESQIVKNIDANWRYETSGVDQGSNWATAAHSNWQTGSGLFGFDTREFPEPIRTTFERPFSRTNYFETEFDLPSASFDDVDSVELFHYVDDGAVFYVNGNEVGRFRMPEGAIDAMTLAESGSDAELLGPIDVPKEMLVPGQNRVSVEVHQSSANSSDVIFGGQIRKNVIVAPGVAAIPFSESEEAWIELHNRSDETVALGDWTFSNGINYTFPSTAMLAPGGYLILADNDEAFRAMHPGTEVFSTFGGRLSNQGERIELVDADKNPVDRVDYHDGGRWPSTPDGGGSSLELRDANANNSVPESWSASDESAATTWKTYSYSGELAASRVGSDNQWRELLLGMLTAGEILIDDISVIENPGTPDAEEIISNGGFDNELEGWRLRGNQRRGEVIDDPNQAGNKVLRIVATGPTEHMGNVIETTVLSRPANRRIYEISYRAKWIAGGNQLHSRIYFHRLPKVTVIERPPTGGTPGKANSTAEPNTGPTFSDLIHSPAVPEPGVPVTVRVRAEDPQGVTALTLFYSIDDMPFAETQMADSGNGQFEASIPGQEAGTVVQFYISGKDSADATSLFPRLGPDSRAAYKVHDGNRAPTDLQNFRIVVTNADRDWMHQDINVMSNDRIPATVIYREDEIYYDVKVRLKGSERARSQRPRVGFSVRFNADQKFRGIHETASIDRSEGVGTGQLEVLFDVMMANSPGKFARYYDLIQIISPQDQHVGGAVLQIGRYEDVWKAQFTDGAAGTRYEYELIYYPTSADRDGNKRPQPDGVAGTAVRDLGDSEEIYRWLFLKKDNREEDDFSSIINYCKHFSKSSSAFEEGLDQVVDIDEWSRGMAYAVLSGAGDNAGAGSQHNGMYYARPDGRVIFLPHDMDFAFDANRTITANPEVAKMARIDRFARVYYGHLYDIATNTYNSDYMKQWTDHFDELLPRQRWSSHLSYISSRSRNVLQQVGRKAAEVEFAVNGDGTFSTDTSTVELTGTGWFDLRSLRIGDEELAVNWTDLTDWQVLLPVEPGETSVVIEAFDFQNNSIGSKEITITHTGVEIPTVPASAQNLAVSEIHYHPSDPSEDDEFIEFVNTSTRNVNLNGISFTDGIAYTFDSEQILSPGARLVLAKAPEILTSMHPTIPESTILAQFEGSLSNGGESITALDANGAIIVDFRYNDKSPWPIDADGEGYSLVLPGPNGSPSDVLDWRLSTVPGGSPGADTVVSLAQWIATNEIGVLGDRDLDGAPDVIEYMTGTSPSIAGVVLVTDGQTVDYPVSLTAENATLTLESSRNLIDWEPVPEGRFEGLVHSRDAPTATAVWRVNDAPEFYRLAIPAE